MFYYVRLTNGERGGRGAASAWAWEENQIEVITGSRLTNAIKVKKEWWNGCVYYVSVWIRGEWGSWILIRLLDGRGGGKGSVGFCWVDWCVRWAAPPTFSLGLFHCDAKIMMPVTVHFLIDVGIFNSCLQAENSIKRPNVEDFFFFKGASCNTTETTNACFFLDGVTTIIYLFTCDHIVFK